MKKVENKMPDQGKERKMAGNIFLPTPLAEAARYRGSTIQAVFFGAFGLVRHKRILLLKIETFPTLNRMLLPSNKAMVIFAFQTFTNENDAVVFSCRFFLFCQRPILL